MEAIPDTNSFLYPSSSEELNSGPKTPKTATMAMTNDISPSDFDFETPCQNFKSSFARSLSQGNAAAHQNGINNNNNTCVGSLDTTSQSGKHISFAQRSSNRNLVAAKKDCPPPVPRRLSFSNGPITSLPPVVRSKNDSKVNDVDVKPTSLYVSLPPVLLPPVLPVRRSLPSNGRQNVCEMQSQRAFQRTAAELTHFARQPASGNNNATVNGDIEPTLYGSYPRSECSSNSNSTNGGSFRRNNNQHTTHHVAIQARANDKNNNGYQHGQHEHINNYQNGDADDGNGPQQLCALCNETAYIKPSAVDMTLTSVDYQAQVKSNPTVMPHKQQRFLSLPSSSSVKTSSRGTPSPVYEPSAQLDSQTDLENTILQNEIYKVRWQLKQLDTRCKMQRDVIEGMARFLDRYHAHTKLKEEVCLKSMEQLPRSVSLFPINGVDSGRSSSSSNISTYGNENEKESSSTVGSNCLRARNKGDSNSYRTFKDYTCRRSPKKLSNNRASGDFTIDEVDMKLSQEAFRLSRTIHNVLNEAAQQPLQSSRLFQEPSNTSIGALFNGSSSLHSSTSVTMAGVPATNRNQELPTNSNSLKGTKNCEAYNRRTSTPDSTGVPGNMNFLRAHGLCGSRLSMRSSTNSSVHSLTSTSTDEDLGLSSYHLNGPPVSLIMTQQLQQQQQQHHHHHHLARLQQQPVNASTTEDESGFSSISSFQEIGVPTNAVLPPQLQKQRGRNGNANNSEDPVLWV